MENEKVSFIVDCENSDPYRLCATFRNIAQHHPEYVSHVSKIILYDDVHTADTWRVFDQYITSVPVDHRMIKRLQENKSLVDISISAGAFEEFYKHDTRAFVIVSSDSDFWALINALPEAKFMVMMEHGKQSQHFLDSLTSSGVFYCYIDTFSQGSIGDIRMDALRSQTQEYIKDAVNLNINTMMEFVCQRARLTPTQTEAQSFIEKHIKRMKLSFDENGDVSLTLP